MASVEEHYESLLADVYSWMYGGFAEGIERNIAFFDRYDIVPKGNRRAVDLGAGSGFQSIPLAERGFDVISIDTDKKLLAELVRNQGAGKIQAVHDDLLNFEVYAEGRSELVLCMTDTLLHLDSRAVIGTLFSNVYRNLEDKGKFILTFRDFSSELTGTDRFIPVRSDDDRTFICFLEYESDHVNVHDVLHERGPDGWELKKSCYSKLRLSKDWVVESLRASGFEDIHSVLEEGVVTVIAGK